MFGRHGIQKSLDKLKIVGILTVCIERNERATSRVADEKRVVLDGCCDL